MRDCPNTKVTNCLREVFRIQPDPALLKYKLHIGQEAMDSTGRLSGEDRLPTAGNGRFNAVVLHYQGNTSTHKKNLPPRAGGPACAGGPRRRLRPGHPRLGPAQPAA